MQQQQQQDMDQYFSDPSESEESDDSEKDFNDDSDYDINGKRGRNFAKQIKKLPKKRRKKGPNLFDTEAIESSEGEDNNSYASGSESKIKKLDKQQ